MVLVYVIFKRTSLRRPVRTNGASERLLPGVYSVMHAEVLPYFKLFEAHGTGILHIGQFGG